MASFPNSARIDSIQLSGMSKQVFCPIGKSWCTYYVGIELVPNRTIPDYLEIQEYFNEQAPKEATLEDFAANIRDKLVEMCSPYTVEVVVSCNDARHMPAKVKTKYVDYRGILLNKTMNACAATTFNYKDDPSWR